MQRLLLLCRSVIATTVRGAASHGLPTGYTGLVSGRPSYQRSIWWVHDRVARLVEQRREHRLSGCGRQESVSQPPRRWWHWCRRIRAATPAWLGLWLFKKNDSARVAGCGAAGRPCRRQWAWLSLSAERCGSRVHLKRTGRGGDVTARGSADQCRQPSRSAHYSWTAVSVSEHVHWCRSSLLRAKPLCARTC